MLSKLETIIPYEWLKKCVTIFADDFHIACLFTSEEELQQAMIFIGYIIDELTNLDFILSPQKSSVIIRGNGSRFDYWKKKRTYNGKHGTRCLFVETSQGQMAIPINRKCTYLGCLVSYGNFEQMTLKMRLATGWRLFRRLQKWLCSRQRAHLALRMKLLQTCVLPCITYGLMYMGLTHSGLQQLCTQITAMYRRVIGNMAHVTGMTHADFYQHYHIRAPAAIINDLWHQALEGLTTALTQTPEHDIIHLTCWGALHRTRSSLDRFGSGPIRELVVQQALKCPHCDACFQHPNLLQRHMTRNHRCPRQVHRRLDMLNDSQEGKAICKHCNKSFTNWTSFKFHVQAGICLSNHDAHHQDDVAGNSNSDDQAPDRMPPPNSLELGDRAYAIAQSGDYELAKEDQALCTYLTQHCVLCNKFMSTSRSYTYHMRHYHQAALQDAISLGLQRCRQYNAMTSPCQFCQTEFTRAHMCIVCTQLAVLEVQHTSEAKEHKCYICSFVADDRTALKRHLSNEHHFSVFDWKPSRDSLEDQQTCAHCGNTYHSIEVLRKHIIYTNLTLIENGHAAETVTFMGTL